MNTSGTTSSRTIEFLFFQNTDSNHLWRIDIRNLENRFGSPENRFGSPENRFGSLENRFRSLDIRFRSLDKELAGRDK